MSHPDKSRRRPSVGSILPLACRCTEGCDCNQRGTRGAFLGFAPMQNNTSTSQRAHVKWSAERGLTLIETLVALVIMSVGLLGIAALHVESVKAARGATLRTKAITLAVDMAEKMRANRVGALAGDYTIGAGDMGSNHNCADDIDGAATV